MRPDTDRSLARVLDLFAWILGVYLLGFLLCAIALVVVIVRALIHWWA